VTGWRAALGACLLACGCGGVGYLGRAAWHEARILWRREPIAALLGRDDLAPALRERLRLVLAVRAFAAGPLGLHVGRSYTSFARVDDLRLWVVTAARRDRLEAHTWRYPLLGRLPYRGFFARGAAEAEARALGARDLDVAVRAAATFSTLGWLADPLLSTVVDAPLVAVAETVIHELFHATLYLPEAATFNESAATFAGHRGAQAFFCAGPGRRPERCREARARWTATRRRGRVLTRLAARLERLYATGPPPTRRERARVRLAAATVARLARHGIDARAELLPPNNAELLGVLLYTTGLDAFERTAPRDEALGPALAALVDGVRGAPDPFGALDGLARRARER
jgi:predicted aminopeptidase